MDATVIAVAIAGAIATILIFKFKKQPVGPAAASGNPQPGGPILDAILQILKQLGEQQPIAAIQARVVHPRASIAISLSKEDTDNAPKSV